MTSSAEGERAGAGGRDAGGDGDAALQDELRREAAERDGLGGDTATDRNMSGASTWITLGTGGRDAEPGEADAPDGRGGSGAP